MYGAEMEELRTLTRVSRLRREIECRQEVVVRAVERGGGRRVTSVARASRSFTRSVLRPLPPPSSSLSLPPPPAAGLPLVEYPPEDREEEEEVAAPSRSVDIVEVTSDDDRPPRKTSVVTLGQGNIVVIGSDEGADIRLTALASENLRPAPLPDRKGKRVGFCKTEVHFAPESGRFNIVETDEKPPPTRIFRRKKRVPREDRGGGGSYSGRGGAPLGRGERARAHDENYGLGRRTDSPRPPAKTGRNSGSVENYLANRGGLTLELAPVKLPPPPPVEPAEMKYLGSASPKLRSLIENSPCLRNNNRRERGEVGSADGGRGDLAKKEVRVVARAASLGSERNGTEPSPGEADGAGPASGRVPRVQSVGEVLRSPRADTPLRPSKITLYTGSPSALADTRSTPTVVTTRSTVPRPRVLPSTSSRSGSTVTSTIGRSGSTAASTVGRSGSTVTSTIGRSGSTAASTVSRSGSTTASTISRSGSNVTSSNIKSGSTVVSTNSKSGSTLVSSNSKSGSTVITSNSKSGSTVITSNSKSGSTVVTSNSKSGSTVVNSNSKSGSTVTRSNGKSECGGVTHTCSRIGSSVVRAGDGRRGSGVATGRESKSVSAGGVSSSECRGVSTWASSCNGTSGRRGSGGGRPARPSRGRGKSAAAAEAQEAEEEERRVPPAGDARRRKTAEATRIRRSKEPLKSFEKVSNGWVGHRISTSTTAEMSRRSCPEELSMTGSYSEIYEEEEEEEEEEEGGRCERPRDLAVSPHFLRQLEGTVTTQEGGLVSFVADDLERKIKLSSPRGEEDWSAATSLVAEIEAEALRVAASVDSLTENLSEILHGVSALTVDCLEAYRDVVCKASDAVDLNIKSMYQLVAKTEELSKSVQPLYKLAAHVKNIKHLLDLLEAG